MELFNEMQQQNISPDSTTFVCVLSGCSHSGLVDQAGNIYNSMESQYNIIPTYKHQACMVDVWGRAGMLEQAETFINNLSTKHISLWETLLGASCNHMNVQYAEKAAAKILELNPHDSSAYVLLANTYATVGNWEKRSQIWHNMIQKNIKKTPGITWVTVNDKTETFHVDSWNHSYLPFSFSLLVDKLYVLTSTDIS